MYLSPNQIHERYLKTLQIKSNKTNNKNKIVVQGISDKYELERLKNIIYKNIGINKNDMSVSSRSNFKKMSSTKNMMRHATGRMMDLKEYTLSFIITPIENNIEEQPENDDLGM